MSVLPVAFKVFERLLQKQVNCYVEEFLSTYLYGYRKGFSTQQALISLIEKWKISLDKKGYGGAIFLDLSKAFDTTNYKLLLEKLHAYSFDNDAYKTIQNYLKNRYQRIKINKVFSSCSEILSRVRQGSVLGPLLFDIYLND